MSLRSRVPVCRGAYTGLETGTVMGERQTHLDSKVGMNARGDERLNRKRR